MARGDKSKYTEKQKRQAEHMRRAKRPKSTNERCNTLRDKQGGEIRS